MAPTICELPATMQTLISTPARPHPAMDEFLGLGDRVMAAE